MHWDQNVNNDGNASANAVGFEQSGAGSGNNSHVIETAGGKVSDLRRAYLGGSSLG